MTIMGMSDEYRGTVDISRTMCERVNEIPRTNGRNIGRREREP